MYAMNDPSEVRQLFFDAWGKFNLQQPLTDLEKQLVTVMVDHPEYHFMFNDPAKYLHKAYLSPEETNPFMHLGMHLVLRDQLSLNNPAGISEIYQGLAERFGNPLLAEHKMMECLNAALWQVMNQGEEFDQDRYMANLQEI